MIHFARRCSNPAEKENEKTHDSPHTGCVLVVLCAPVVRGATGLSGFACSVPVVACDAPTPELLRKLRGTGVKKVLTYDPFFSIFPVSSVFLNTSFSCPPGVAALFRRATFLSDCARSISPEEKIDKLPETEFKYCALGWLVTPFHCFNCP